VIRRMDAGVIGLGRLSRALAVILVVALSLAPAPALASPAGATTAETTWSGWSEVPGAGQTTDAPSAVKFGRNHYLFVRGTDDLIYRNVLTADGWSGWAEVPGGATHSAPAASVYHGALRLYVRGTDNLIYVNRLTTS
jgi:hypothetical protein